MKVVFFEGEVVFSAICFCDLPILADFSFLSLSNPCTTWETVSS